MESGTNTSLKKTSLNSARPVACFIGLISSWGLFMSIRNVRDYRRTAIIHRRRLKRLWHKRLPQSEPSVDGPDFRSHPTRALGGRLQAGGATLATICYRSI